MPEQNSMASSPGNGLAQVEKVIHISDELGLHARPAARIAQAAQQFESHITLNYEDMTVDAKSILDILTLAAGHGACLILRCNGMDADSAAAELTSLFAECAAVEE